MPWNMEAHVMRAWLAGHRAATRGMVTEVGRLRQANGDMRRAMMAQLSDPEPKPGINYRVDFKRHDGDAVTLCTVLTREEAQARVERRAWVFDRPKSDYTITEVTRCD